jgi:predicted nucleotidyltransferase
MTTKPASPFLSLAERLGNPWPTLAQAWSSASQARSDLNALLQKEVGNYASEDTSVVVFGSLARNEWLDWISDLDWTYLIDGQAKSGHLDIAQQIRKALKSVQRTTNCNTEYRFGEPGATGTFGNLAISHELVHLIGGQDDTNKNTTRRILLLLESSPIGLEAAYVRVIRAIIHRYLEEEAHHVMEHELRFKVPRFLLNDIVRFWRTMAVDFASKQRDRGGEGWGLRNAKLRMSRKLLFASGLLMCFGCNLDPMLQRKISTTNGDINLRHLENHIVEFARLTPLDVLARAVDDYSIDEQTAKQLFDAYEGFLSIMADKQEREELKRLQAKDSRTDKVFGRIRELSSSFEAALTKVFHNEWLKPLAIKYGVF